MLALKEIQALELNILLAFDKFCRDNGICYSLASGSMIGAVRHQGFIPWDDDIDIYMLRSEYNNFLQKMRESSFILSERYKVLIPWNDGYYYPFVKIIDTMTTAREINMRPIKGYGIWIDIFPIDFINGTSEQAASIALEQFNLMHMYYKYLLRFPLTSFLNMMKDIWLAGFSIINWNLPHKVRTACKSLENNSCGEYCGPLSWFLSENECYPAEYFKDEYKDVLFEEHTVMMFAEYDRILRHRYGDYMKLPHESERKSHSLVSEMRNACKRHT